ncbi:hypothetical protein [Mesorhizobium sp. 113-3-3]|uniref:hypothetical protein n=1 Tax=Mesorhizobium sp. 113-3-3 TaxID=2744516 RepID=UPI0019390D4E|nr:hypothetical protein [Mesorhizobium sp. 113-3-3]BCG77460.1 hypothetical protein MesoLj113b_10020 [Mesorhizobium sp. 113-3-3]
MKNSISLLLGAVVVLAVCQSSQAGAKREPKADLDECVAAARTSSLTFKREMASFMGVSQERMPALFCQRLADGVRSGRISYSDINNLQLDQPTEIWMVLKGKAKAAAPTQSQAPRSPNFRNCSGIAGAFQVPASQKCPASGYAQNSGIPVVIEGKREAVSPAPQNPRFRNCSGIDGTFQVPISQKCPLSGYANH